MTEEDYKDMVIAHDKHIDTLATSIESLATNVGSTNSKLDDVIDVITQQNVLVERMNNMDTNVAESFTRAWDRLSKLETKVDQNGCSIAKGLEKEKDVFVERLKVVNNRIGDTEEDMRTIREKISAFVGGTTIKWAVGLLIFYSITFGGYVVSFLHSTDNKVVSFISSDKERRASTERRLDAIISIMRKNNNNVVLYKYDKPVPLTGTE